MDRLPAIADRPGQIVVIYDGQCRFCLAGVRQLARWDWLRKLTFVSLHDAEVSKRWPQLTHSQLMEQMYVVSPQGQCMGGAGGFRYLTRHIPVLWPLAPWMHVPGTLGMWQRLYLIVAKARYRLAGRVGEPCDGGTCAVHLTKPTHHSPTGSPRMKPK